jgi:hypothetical protein
MKAGIKLVIIVLVAVYLLFGFAIISPLVNTLTGNAVILDIGIYPVFSFLVAFFVVSRFTSTPWEGLFSKMEGCERARTWMRLHAFFTNIACGFYPIIAVGSLVVALYYPATSSRFPEVFMLTWMIVFLDLITLWFFHSILGMGYEWFCKGTKVGIFSLSFAASKELKNKKSVGMQHLIKALLMFRDFLQREQLELKAVDDTIKIVRCLLLFKSKIPYNTLRKVSRELDRFPFVEKLPSVLTSFSAQASVGWASAFCTKQMKGRTLLEYVLVAATVLTSLTFIPEESRKALLDTLQTLSSSGNVMLIIGTFFLFIMIYIQSQDTSYRLGLRESRLTCP